MKLLLDESLSPRLVELLRDLFRGSESALRNGLAGAGDIGNLEYGSTRNCVLTTNWPPTCFGVMRSVSLGYPILKIP